MAHMFKQIYCDEVDFERVTHVEIINLVFTAIVHGKITELEKQKETMCKVKRVLFGQK